MASSKRSSTKLVAATSLALLGLLLGAMTRGSTVRAEQTCPKKACNVDSGNCTSSDVQYKCDEISGSPGCSSTAC
jgi:hypothetical protein